MQQVTEHEAQGGSDIKPDSALEERVRIRDAEYEALVIATEICWLLYGPALRELERR